MKKTQKKEIRALFCINTPAQAHTWLYAIKDLIQKGYQVKVLARDYGSTADILKCANVPSYVFFPIHTNYFRIFEIMVHLWNGFKVSRNFSPTMIIGFGVDSALLAALSRKSGIVFTDSESMPLQIFLTKMFANAIVTPGCFTEDLGMRHIRIDGYKELAYLHPDNFTPDPSIFTELNISPNEKYVILRFNAFDAFHDVNKHGFTTEDRIILIRELSKYARVYISPEGPLSEDLNRYRLPIPYERIHHALYYAHLLVTDTQTMATEATILGTPAVRCNNLVNTIHMGNFIELEQKYDVMYSFHDTEKAKAIQKAIDLIKLPDLKEQWAIKRQRMLKDKINVTKFLVKFIEDFPDSMREFEQKRGNS